MSRDMLFAMAAGVASALVGLAFLARTPGAVLLIYLGPLPLLLAGLALGRRASAVAAGVGVLLSGLLAGLPAMLLYAAGHALPALTVVWLALRQRAGIDIVVGGPSNESAPSGPADPALPEPVDGGLARVERMEWYPHGYIAAWLALLAAAMIGAAALYFSSGDGFRAAINDHVEPGLSALAARFGGSDLKQINPMIVGLFPGLVGVSWVIMSVVNAVIAQAIITRSGRAIRPKQAWGDFALPDWISWALVGSALLALIGPGDVGYTGRNLAMALAFSHFLLGLVVVHDLAGRASQPVAILIAFYVVLSFSPWVWLVVAAIGVLEHWIGLRNRIPGGPRAGSPKT